MEELTKCHPHKWIATMKLVVRVGSTYNLMTRKHYWNKQKEDPTAGCAITTLRRHSHPFV
jgi:hypothetical protein